MRPVRAALAALAVAAAAVLVRFVFFRPGGQGDPWLVPRFDLGGFVARRPGPVPPRLHRGPPTGGGSRPSSGSPRRSRRGAPSAALALLSHAGMVAASLAGGLVSAVERRTALADLLRRRREVARLARPPTPPDPPHRA